MMMSFLAPEIHDNLEICDLKVLSTRRITRDKLYNVYEIPKSSDFIWKFATFPDLICACALKEILHEMECFSNTKQKCWTFDII